MAVDKKSFLEGEKSLLEAMLTQFSDTYMRR